jgi:hypothetical protein
MSPLPARTGQRPSTSTHIPHRQLDQQPTDKRYLDQLIETASTWLGVTEAASAVSVAGARALVLTDDGELGPPDAFMVGREFCHGHAQGDYSLHACLPGDLAMAAQQAGWAELHFLAQAGQLPRTVVMLYAPRDEFEFTIILSLVHASYQFARTPSPEAPTFGWPLRTLDQILANLPPAAGR